MKTRFIKHLTAAIVGVGASVALASCEDYLDVSPESSFTAEEIFSSETESKAMLGSIYSKLTDKNLYGLALPYTFKTNTDVEMTSNGNQFSTSGNGDEVHCFDVRSLWTSLRNTWNSAYSAINYCNDFIENMEQSPLFSTEVAENGPTAMQQMYGEAKCLRALLYLDLMRIWGDVVFRTHSTEASESLYNEGVTDRDEIYTTLINDLRETEKYMMYSSQLDEGVERASREYCQALIGQLALYRAGYSLRPGGTVGVMERASDYMDYYAIAREYLYKVINEGRHSLSLESFEDLWRGECNWSVLQGGDVIFEIPMLKEYSGSLGYNIGMVIGYDSDHPSHSYGQGRNNASLCGLYPFTFDPRDLRLDITCVPYSYDEELNQTVALGKSCVSGWNIGKWSKLYMNNLMTGSGDNTGINAIRMRYADVLLMFAEVENELSGPTAAAKDALKTVRRRAFLPEDHAEMVEDYVDALGTKEQFFQAIMDERAWEFGGEGVRKYDLARWNKYGEVLVNLYNKFTDWGHRANGLGVAGDVRDRVYWRELSNPGDPNHTYIEFKGLKEYGDNIGDHPASEGWVNVQNYAIQWYYLDQETGEWTIHDDVKWSFRGFINYNNASTVQPTDPVRYLCPYPVEVITSHRGSIQQQYGYQ
ncbi:MAG: RagB/SusD family nutrient uptake outer membrane protein [Muribaculaceae bacterium]|nr:RagB/SusD family nutrient uptake outer membrane protein [Muribaculaceae bacterium]